MFTLCSQAVSPDIEASSIGFPVISNKICFLCTPEQNLTMFSFIFLTLFEHRMVLFITFCLIDCFCSLLSVYLRARKCLVLLHSWGGIGPDQQLQSGKLFSCISFQNCQSLSKEIIVFAWKIIVFPSKTANHWPRK